MAHVFYPTGSITHIRQVSGSNLYEYFIGTGDGFIIYLTGSGYNTASLSASYVTIGKSMVLCSAYTPTGSGADVAELSVPYSPVDGVTVISWNVKRLHLRAQTVETSSTVVDIEKSNDTGIFSASLIGTITVGSGSYEGATTGSLGVVTSNDRIRFNVNTLGSCINWTITTEISNA